jgi:Uma2 family endonuclease
VKSPTTNNRERTIASALAKADEYYTAEDYLRNEREADERHEYWQGKVFNMASDATLIIEVLSPSTESRDRGAKFFGYQNLSSLQEYVLVSQEAILVEVFRKEQSRHWHYEVLQSLEAALKLESVAYSGTLGEWYEDTGLLEEAA